MIGRYRICACARPEPPGRPNRSRYRASWHAQRVVNFRFFFFLSPFFFSRPAAAPAAAREHRQRRRQSFRPQQVCDIELEISKSNLYAPPTFATCAAVTFPAVLRNNIPSCAPTARRLIVPNRIIKCTFVEKTAKTRHQRTHLTRAGKIRIFSVMFRSVDLLIHRLESDPRQHAIWYFRTRVFFFFFFWFFSVQNAKMTYQ